MREEDCARTSMSLHEQASPKDTFFFFCLLLFVFSFLLRYVDRLVLFCSYNNGRFGDALCKKKVLDVGRKHQAVQATGPNKQRRLCHDVSSVSHHSETVGGPLPSVTSSPPSQDTRTISILVTATKSSSIPYAGLA